MPRSLFQSCWLLLVLLGSGFAASASAEGPVSNHWVFQPVVRAPVPAVHNAEWIRNAIDNFVLAKLESLGIEPSPEADRHTLIRRLSIDLIGLLPTPDEVDAFVNDSSPDAYERLVEQLLASPHFGERWARHWLDLARYADSDGYEKDSPRPHAWRWRNWVIGAINQDMPFDEFTVEQLAGDLLSDPTLEQRVATGFHRNTLTNREGGVDQEEYRIKAVVDRVNTTGTVWLGLTVGCAQCHSHKYDPLAQEEYYGLFAFFNTGQEVDMDAPLAEEAARYTRARDAYDKVHAPLETALAAYDKEQLPLRQAEWETSLRAASGIPAWTLLNPVSFASAGGAEITEQEDHSLRLGGVAPDKDTYTVVVNTELAGITGIELEVLGDPSLPQKGPGRADKGNFVLSEFSLTAAPLGDPGRAAPVTLENATAQVAEKDFPIANAVDGKPDTGWAIGDGRSEAPDPFAAVFQTHDAVKFDGGTTLVFTLRQEHGSKHTLGRFRLLATTVEREKIPALLPERVAHALSLRSEDRTDEQRSALTRYYRTIDPQRISLVEAIARHAETEPPKLQTRALTLAENPNPPETHVLVRGDFLRPSDKVEPHTPAVLSLLKPRGERPDRLDLARWIVDPTNPLTSRVAANDIWQHLFGRGLVATPEDFGTRGEPPSHPELLDWLASEYLRRGWSRKDMIRLIVGSATYRQESRPRSDLADRDATNRLLARQNRFRVEAEVVHDLNLAASGLLNPAIGGPSIRPPLPAGVAALGYANQIKWEDSQGAEKYRRGLYIFFQRTVPYPMLMTFDSPDSNVVCTRRERSNTPLQALTLLNGPVFVECAQALGRRLAEQASGSTQDRIRLAFRLCLAREPTDSEMTRLEQLYSDLHQLASADPAAAAQLVGQPSATDVTETAAWVALGRTILNLDEFVTRE